MSDKTQKETPPVSTDEDLFDDPAFTAHMKPDDASMLRLLAARAQRKPK